MINRLKDFFNKSKIRINIPLPFISYELSVDELLNSKNIDQRIERLGEIKQELQSAILAVESLQTDAQNSKTEVEKLQSKIKELEKA